MQIHSFRFSLPFFCFWLSVLHSPLAIIQFRIGYMYFASLFDFFPLYILAYNPNILVRIFWSLSRAENTEQNFFFINRSLVVNAVNPKCDWNAWLWICCLSESLPFNYDLYTDLVCPITARIDSTYSDAFIFFLCVNVSNKSVKCFWCLVKVTRTN